MRIREFQRAGALHGEIEVPGDKSISHLQKEIRAPLIS